VADDGALVPLEMVQHPAEEGEAVRQFVVHAGRIVGGEPVPRLVQAYKPRQFHLRLKIQATMNCLYSFFVSFQEFCLVKGTVSADLNCMKVISIKSSWLGNVTQDIKNCLTFPSIFNWSLKFLNIQRQTIEFTNSFF
jgi:hypothetical protein